MDDTSQPGTDPLIELVAPEAIAVKPDASPRLLQHLVSAVDLRSAPRQVDPRSKSDADGTLDRMTLPHAVEPTEGWRA
jgi:hypothetical protein